MTKKLAVIICLALYSFFANKAEAKNKNLIPKKEFKTQKNSTKKIAPQLCNYTGYDYVFDSSCGGYTLLYVSAAYWCDSGVIYWPATFIATSGCGSEGIA